MRLAVKFLVLLLLFNLSMTYIVVKYSIKSYIQRADPEAKDMVQFLRSLIRQLYRIIFNAHIDMEGATIVFPFWKIIFFNAICILWRLNSSLMPLTSIWHSVFVMSLGYWNRLRNLPWVLKIWNSGVSVWLFTSFVLFSVN